MSKVHVFGSGECEQLGTLLLLSIILMNVILGLGDG